MDLPCTLAVRPVRADSADAKPDSRNAATTFGHACTASCYEQVITTRTTMMMTSMPVTVMMMTTMTMTMMMTVMMMMMMMMMMMVR